MVRQLAQRNDSAEGQVQNLGRENRELSEVCVGISHLICMNSSVGNAMILTSL